MAQQMIRGGAPLDIPTADENATEVDRRMRAFYAEQRVDEQARERERLRGVKRMTFSSALATPALTRFTFADLGAGPQAGFMWMVNLLSAQLATAGTFQAFITSDTDTTKTAASQRRLVASGASSLYQVFTYAKLSCVLMTGESFMFNAGTNIVSYYINAWEVPEEMAGKLL